MVQRPPVDPRFLSLKWVVMLSLSLLLLLVNGALSYVAYTNLIKQFESQRQTVYERQNRAVVGVLHRSLENLVNLSLQVPRLAVGQGGERQGIEHYRAVLETHWETMHLDWGVSVARLYDAQGNLLASWGEHPILPEREWVGQVLAADSPVTKHACTEFCRQYAVIPLLYDGGSVGALMLGQSLADTILTLQHITGMEVGVVSAALGELDSGKHLPHWQMEVAELTHADESLPQLQALAREQSLDQVVIRDAVQFGVNDRLELRLVPLFAAPDKQAYVVLIDDISEELARVETGLRQSIAVGVIGLIASETLLLLILWRPTSRLRRSAELLPLLAKSAYGKVREALINIDPKPQRWQDELDVLEHSAIDLSYQLEFLEHEISKRTQQLEHLALRDSLTGLANRRLLSELVDHALHGAKREHKQIALLFLDLDRFKKVNDSMGHAAGDRLLKAVANRLVETLREEDTVARLGGDEFVVLLEQVDEPGHVRQVAEKILHVLQQPVSLDGQDITVTTSIGVVLGPSDGDNAVTLMKNADMAMYKAKELGRNKYLFYTQELNAELEANLSLETELRRALSEGEFVLHYHPQVHLHTGQINGVEALVRWHHPKRGLVWPVEFIGLMEETGLIIQLGRWVLEEVCQQLKFWRNLGLVELKVGVNLSPRQFSYQELYSAIGDILREAGASAEWIDLEITESLLMENLGEAVEQLNQLKSLGVSLSIDDFGTGYSSLSYLKRLPVDTLKIDRDFVHDIPHDPQDMEITAAVIAMAQKLGLGVIAEGVQTKEQVAFLKRNGCLYGQGDYFCQPLPAKTLTPILLQYCAGVEDATDKLIHYQAQMADT